MVDIIFGIELSTCRYFKFELYPKGAIAKADMPPFLLTWLDRGSADCMFSPTQLKNWTSSHLQACPWYLECNFGTYPPEEEALFNMLNAAAPAVPEFDEFKGLDEEARGKAIKKRDALDQRKVARLEEAKKKTGESKKKKMEAKALKEKEKATKAGMKRKASTPVQEPATSTANQKEGSSGFSLTQECLVHGLAPTLQTLDPVPDTDECILNLSIAILPGNTMAYNDVLTFLDSVNTVASLLQNYFI